MSTKMETICDLCGVSQPKDYAKQKGWAYLRVTGAKETSQDYCPTCWAPVEKILLRNFVDGLLLEAQWVTEES